MQSTQQLRHSVWPSQRLRSTETLQAGVWLRTRYAAAFTGRLLPPQYRDGPPAGRRTDAAHSLGPHGGGPRLRASDPRRNDDRGSAEHRLTVLEATLHRAAPFQLQRRRPDARIRARLLLLSQRREVTSRSV